MNIFFLLITSLSASVVKHESAKLALKEFEYKDVCETLGAKNSVLITPKSLTEIECLNKTFRVSDFCLKKFGNDDNLSRGLIDPEKKKAVCEFSDNVTISISCVDNHKKYCASSQKSCEALKKVYALKLELAHQSIIENTLNCYYQKTIGEKPNELYDEL